MAATNGLLLAVAAQSSLGRPQSRSGIETLLGTGAQNMTRANPDTNSPSEDAAVEAFVALLMGHRHRIYAFIAKHLDLRKVSKRKLDKIFGLLNNRPRKRLGYRSPAEVIPRRRAVALQI